MTPEERCAKIDQRLDAIAMRLRVAASMGYANGSRMEQMDKRIDKLLATAEKDGEYICALLRVTESRDPRRNDLEGGLRKN